MKFMKIIILFTLVIVAINANNDNSAEQKNDELHDKEDPEMFDEIAEKVVAKLKENGDNEDVNKRRNDPYYGIDYRQLFTRRRRGSRRRRRFWGKK